ncbi:hypothetical protein PINS_up010251 [Pythium insidiosum]|nr:hypothetical protein PINS_up010251 [Pythium insidiosum]
MVPDLVGIAWLRQVAQRDPSKKEMVSKLMERLRFEDDERPTFDHDASGQVDIYDTLCDLAAQTLSCKFAVVNLTDENRQWFKSAVNVKESDVPRDFSFCEYPVRDRCPLVVMDAARDPRLANHPFVTGPLGVRFLAAAPLFTVDNQCVGAVCVMDTEPRHSLQESQLATMQNLAHLAMVMVQERREAQSKLQKIASSSQLVSASRQLGHQAPRLERGRGPSYASSDLVPLSAYANETAIVPQQSNSISRAANRRPCSEGADDPVAAEGIPGP